MRVVLLGDSHLARLQLSLGRIGDDVVNAAVGGAMADDVLHQAQRLPVRHDDVAVLSVGTNDTFRAVTVDDFTQTLADLVARVVTARWVYLVPPLRDSADYDAAARDVLAGSGSSAVVDSPGLLAPLGDEAFLDDGIHLTEAAYDVLLPAVAAACSTTRDDVGPATRDG